MKTNKGILKIILAIILALIVVVGGIIYFNYDGHESPPGKHDQQNNSSISTTSISTSLPDKYVDAQSWPPVVKDSNFAYSCNPTSGLGDVPTVIKEKIVNGRKYCITSVIDAGAGSRFGEYTYVTPTSTGGTKTTSFNLRWSACFGYGQPGETQYDECQTTVSNFLSNLDNIIDSLMSK